jgi:hypothetical protein
MFFKRFRSKDVKFTIHRGAREVYGEKHNVPMKPIDYLCDSGCVIYVRYPCERSSRGSSKSKAKKYVRCSYACLCVRAPVRVRTYFEKPTPVSRLLRPRAIRVLVVRVYNKCYQVHRTRIRVRETCTPVYAGCFDT